MVIANHDNPTRYLTDIVDLCVSLGAAMNAGGNSERIARLLVEGKEHYFDLVLRRLSVNLSDQDTAVVLWILDLIYAQIGALAWLQYQTPPSKAPGEVAEPEVPGLPDPAVQAPKLASRPSEIRKPAVPMKILLVDDEHTIAQNLRVILAQHGFAVTTTYDGESAVNIASDWKPDIFLADVTMPVMSGYEAAMQIRAALPHCRVVLFSARLASGELPQRATLECEFLSKPVRPDELLDRLRSAPARSVKPTDEHAVTHC